mmetsp:Transcript_15609/g.39982  ORF Transcript_15609/g.39982 Transcript_15609/m.39982 type:complete len:97 (-) Transcript_15609:345-635(-)
MATAEPISTLPTSLQNGQGLQSHIRALHALLEGDGHPVTSPVHPSQRLHGPTSQTRSHESGSAQNLEELSLEASNRLDRLQRQEVFPTKPEPLAAH